MFHGGPIIANMLIVGAKKAELFRTAAGLERPRML
jgi:hypothetical protein